MQPHRQQPTRLPRPWDSPGKNTGVGCHFLLQCMKAKSEKEVAQLCQTLSDPMDCSPPASSVHGLFQSRVLERVAIAFSRVRLPGFNPWVEKIPWRREWRRQWQPTPVLLPGKSHGRRRLVGYSPWGLEESDTTERLHFQFSLSCMGEGNGNPLQCSCLKNPRDRGAWWAAVYGVAQSRTRLKPLSSSSSIP